MFYIRQPWGFEIRASHKRGIQCGAAVGMLARHALGRWLTCARLRMLRKRGTFLA